jgi:hypothetical protein
MIYTIARYPVHLNVQVANGQVRDHSTLPQDRSCSGCSSIRFPRRIATVAS